MSVNLKYKIPPVRFNDPIVTPQGTPTDQFIRLWEQLQENTAGLGENVPVNLNDLSDINADSPADGEVLTYDAAFGEWKPTAGGGMSHQQVMARTSIGV